MCLQSIWIEVWCDDDDDDDNNEDPVMQLITWVVAMATAGLHRSRVSTVWIADFVISGDKFLKWDDVSFSLWVKCTASKIVMLLYCESGAVNFIESGSHLCKSAA